MPRAGAQTQSSPGTQNPWLMEGTLRRKEARRESEALGLPPDSRPHKKRG